MCSLHFMHEIMLRSSDSSIISTGKRIYYDSVSPSKHILEYFVILMDGSIMLEHSGSYQNISLH